MIGGLCFTNTFKNLSCFRKNGRFEMLRALSRIFLCMDAHSWHRKRCADVNSGGRKYRSPLQTSGKENPSLYPTKSKHWWN